MYRLRIKIEKYIWYNTILDSAVKIAQLKIVRLKMGMAYPAYFSPRYLEPSHIEEELKHGFLKVKDSHTARVKGYKFPYTLEATVKSPFIKIDDNTVVVYNTELDEQLGLSSESKLSEYGKYPSWMNTGILWKTLVLDKSRRWELVDHLKSIALTQTICSGYHGKDPDQIEFVLPVTGYTVFRTKDTLSKTKKRTKKKGKFFFRMILDEHEIAVSRRYTTQLLLQKGIDEILKYAGNSEFLDFSSSEDIFGPSPFEK